jgi:hypothetical protein
MFLAYSTTQVCPPLIISCFSRYRNYLFRFNASIHGQNLKSMLDSINVPKKFIIALKQQLEPTVRIAYEVL